MKKDNRRKQGSPIKKLGSLIVITSIIAFASIKAARAWEYHPGENKYIAHIDAAKEYMNEEYYVEAIDEFRKAQELKSTSDSKISIAECYLLLGDMNSFKTEADEALQQYGYSERLYMDYVYYYDYQKETAEEIKLLEEAVLEYPESEYLRLCYDSVKGDYTEEGNTYDMVYALADGYDIVVDGEETKVITGEEKSVSKACFDAVFDISKGEEIRISALKDGQVNYYDKEGYRRKTPEGDYDFLGNYYDGYALSHNADGWFYIDEKGEAASKYYEAATSYSDGIAAVKENGSWMIIGRNFKPVSGEKYEDIVKDEANNFVFAGRIFAKDKTGYLMLDTEGNVISSGYTEVKPFMEEDGYAAVFDNEGWKVIDASGNCIEKVSCDELRASGNGLMPYRVGELWGYIGVSDGIYVEPVFEDALRVNDKGYAAVKINGQWTYIHFTKF